MSAEPMLILTLPAAAQCRAQSAPSHWWRVRDGQMVDAGNAGRWPVPEDGERIVAIAPITDTAMHVADTSGLSVRQAAVAARLLASEVSATPADALHCAIGTPGPAMPIILADATAMATWLQWCGALGLDPDAIIAAALIPPAPERGFTLANIGDDGVLRGTSAALPDEPMLRAAIVGDADVQPLAPEAVDAALIAEAASPSVNLRQGLFTKARPSQRDAQWLRRMALWTAALLLLSLGIAIARLAHTRADTARLDREASALVESVLSPAPPPERAIGELDARIATLGGAQGRATTPIAALMALQQRNSGVAIDQLGWRADGTLNVTLGAARAEEINAVLIALQSAGWRITATPRTGSDGRALGDISIRSAP